MTTNQYIKTINLPSSYFPQAPFYTGFALNQYLSCSTPCNHAFKLLQLFTAVLDVTLTLRESLTLPCSQLSELLVLPVSGEECRLQVLDPGDVLLRLPPGAAEGSLRLAQPAAGLPQGSVHGVMKKRDREGRWDI